MGSHALALALRAQALYFTVVMRSGIGEGLAVALYHRKPIDPMELAEWLSVDLKPMLEAQRVIEVTGDGELMRAAADLVLAGMALLGKATDVMAPCRDWPRGQPGQRPDRWLGGLIPLRRNPVIEDAIQQAARHLGKQLRIFTRVTRERIGVSEPEAVIHAFPELFAESEASVGGHEKLPGDGHDAARWRT